MKFAKKSLQIFMITVLVIFVLIFLAPILFKGKIREVTKRELNRLLTAEVDFSDIKLSLIRNFPNTYVALEDLTVIGTGEFEGDTLLSLTTFSVLVNTWSVIKMDSIEVKSVLLNRANLNPHINENGRANWDIMKPGEKTKVAHKQKETIVEPPSKKTEAAHKDTSTSTIKVAFRNFEIHDSKITLRNDTAGMEATLRNINYQLQGDLLLKTRGKKIESYNTENIKVTKIPKKMKR